MLDFWVIFRWQDTVILQHTTQWDNPFIWVASLEGPGFEPLQFQTQGFFSRRSTD